MFEKGNAPERVVILGARGQVGRAVARVIGPQKAILLDRSQVDLSRPETLWQKLEPLEPEWVINAAAYTQVDRAESEEELAFRINADAPGALAEGCAKRGIRLVHFSTDYVFGGTGTSPWREEDSVSPLNVYGRSKLEGERRIQAAGERHWIFRTSWVFDEQGHNFVRTMLRLAAEKDSLRVVSDQIGAPTYASHLAQAVWSAITTQGSAPAGIYHLTASGETNWHGFAVEILECARTMGFPIRAREVQAISSAEFPTPAQRPKNSRLDGSKAKRLLGIELPDWREGLQECLERMQGLKQGGEKLV